MILDNNDLYFSCLLDAKMANKMYIGKGNLCIYFLFSYFSKVLCIRGMWVGYFSLHKLQTLHAIIAIALNTRNIYKCNKKETYWKLYKLSFRYLEKKMVETPIIYMLDFS